MDESIKSMYDTVFYWVNMARFATLFHVRKVNHFLNDYVTTFKIEYEREMHHKREQETNSGVHSPVTHVIEDTSSNITNTNTITNTNMNMNMNNERNQRLMDDFLIFPQG
jgi:hypothetical protein